MSTNAEFANELAWVYEYLKAKRAELNTSPDRNIAPLMQVDERLVFVLFLLDQAVAVLRRPETDGISLAFTSVRTTHP